MREILQSPMQIIQQTGVLHLQYHKIQNTYSKWIIFGDV